MAALLLTTSVGVTLHRHYCMGRLIDTSINHPAASCMSMMDMGDASDAMGCCKDTVEEFKVDDLQKAHFDFNATPDLNLLAVVTYVLVDYKLFSTATTQKQFLNYKPPLIAQDVPVLVQSFLL